jgi:DNA-binding NtrC family response regulator
MTDRQTQAVTRDDTWVTPDGAVLSVLSGGAKGKSIPLPGEVGEAIKVGAADDNDLALPDATVSRKHFIVTRTERGLLLSDNGSTNGVRVGDVLVKEALLEPGTRIVAGNVELMVTVQARGAVVPPSADDAFGFARGRSLAMRRLFGVLERAAAGSAPVLLVGENGSGKGTLARSIHERSARKGQRFEVVDCGALAGPGSPETELFGAAQEGGAPGAFERANGGTLFLDDVDELPMALQAAIGQVLETKEIRRGATGKAVQVDVRVVGATSKDLRDEIRAGRFREDLFFRLAVVTVPVPALRARIEDIPLLVEVLMPSGGSPLRVSADAMRELRAYDWPGNVRELRNVLDRTLALAQASGETEIKGFYLKSTRSGHEGSLLEFEQGVSYRDARARVESAFEAAFTRWICDLHRGNVSAAARAAKMDRKYLAELIRKHGVRS